MMTTNKSRAANLEVATRGLGNWWQTIDITLDMSVIVLTTLRDVAKIPPVPYLSTAAFIALAIVEVVQKMRSNKGGFKELAKDSCDIVYEIINAHKDVSKLEGLADLENNLVHLVNVLRSIEEFARKGASRNFFVTILRSSADAGRIQDHKQKLDQAIHVFGLRSHISVRKTVAQLAANQDTIINQLNSIASVAPPPYSPSVPHSLLILTDILRRAPKNEEINVRTLYHLENVLIEVDNFKGISTQIKGRQDRKNLMEFMYHVQRSKLLSLSCLNDSDARVQRLLNILKRTQGPHNTHNRRIALCAFAFAVALVAFAVLALRYTSFRRWLEPSYHWQLWFELMQTHLLQDI